MASKRKKTKSHMKPYEHPATPQTRKKFGPRTLQSLVDNKRITGYELRAASEIEDVYAVLCARMFCRGMRFGERTDSSPSDFPEWFLQAYHRRYLPWAKSYDAGQNAQKNRTLEVVYDIVIDGMSGRYVDAKFGWKPRTAIAVLINGLRDYSRVGGWVDGNTLREWAA